MKQLFSVVYEDADLLVINKPAGLVCHPTKGDVYSSLVSRVRLYLGEGKEAHLINRLDRETSGLVLVAKARGAAVALRRIWEQRTVRKEYLALVHGFIGPDHEMIDAPLGRDEASRVVIKDCVRPDGAHAITDLVVVSRFTRGGRDFSLARVTPRTGRKHQIRIHLEHFGHPIVGDKLYGGDEQIYLDFVEGRLTQEQSSRLLLPHHALHACRLQFTLGERPFQFQAGPEKWFSDFLPPSQLLTEIV